jgi:hypothetical protein
MSKEAQLKKNFDYILKDFEPDPEPKEIFKPAATSGNQANNNHVFFCLK